LCMRDADAAQHEVVAGPESVNIDALSDTERNGHGDRILGGARARDR